MTTDKSTEQPPRRNKVPLLLGLGVVAVIIIGVVVVLVLAGGDKTTDGHVRVGNSSVTASTIVTNSNGGAPEQPVH
jgi:hypothetical protein